MKSTPATKKTFDFKKFIHNDNVVGHIFAAPFIFGFICFSLIPIITSFYYSFTNYSLGSKEAEFVALRNFTRLLSDEIFVKSMGVTLKYVFISHNHKDHSGGLTRLIEKYPQLCTELWIFL